MNSEFSIKKGEMNQEQFKEFISKYDGHMDHIVDILMLLERDELFIKMNLKKLLFYVYRNNKDLELK